MLYLIEKGRIRPDALNELRNAMAAPNAVLQHVPFDHRAAVEMAEIRRQNVPDLPDRAIAATARLLGVPVLSRDRRISESGVKTIW